MESRYQQCQHETYSVANKPHMHCVPFQGIGQEAFADKGGDVLIETIMSNPNKARLDADAAQLRKVVKFKIKPAPTD